MWGNVFIYLDRDGAKEIKCNQSVSVKMIVLYTIVAISKFEVVSK